MMRYNPGGALDAKAWLELDDKTRANLAESAHVAPESWHPSGGISRMHATLHAVVETQIALESPARDTLVRLLREGLHRHEAVHAIGAVLIDHVVAAARPGGPKLEDVDPSLLRNLASLTARRWQSGAITGKKADAANRAERRSASPSKRPKRSKTKAAQKKKKKKKRKK